MRAFPAIVGASMVSAGILFGLGCTHTVVETYAQPDGSTTLPAPPGSTSGGGGSSGSTSSGSSSGSSSGGSSSGSSGTSSSSGSSGTSSSSGSSGTSSGGPATCPAASVDPSFITWKPPAAPQATCTQADVDAMDAYLTATPNASVADFETFVQGRGAACKACVFTDASLATWGPVPMSGADAVAFDMGGCVATESGKPACGQALQAVDDCIDVACADCADATSYQTCETSVTGAAGVCATYVSTFDTQCAGVSSSVFDATCATIVDAIRVACVTTTPPDAGP